MLNKCCITVFNICVTILLKCVVPLSIHFTSNLQKGIALTRAVDICRQVHLKGSQTQTEHASAQILIHILCRTFKRCILTIIFENNSITRQNIGRINSPLDSKVLLSFEAILERMYFILYSSIIEFFSKKSVHNYSKTKHNQTLASYATRSKYTCFSRLADKCRHGARRGYNTLLKKSDRSLMEVRRLRMILKSLNDLNPSFMKNLCNKRNSKNRRKNDLIIHTRNSITFESNSLRCLGAHVWKTLPENIKEITSFEKFKESINNWYEPNCKCSLCYYKN